MAEPPAPATWLRVLTVACVLLAQGGAVLAMTRVRPMRLAREDWTQDVMAAGMRSLPPAGFPESLGMVELYRDGAIVLLTTEGLDEIHVDAETIIVQPHGPGILADLRPGVSVAVWGRRAALADVVTARAILVP